MYGDSLQVDNKLAACHAPVLAYPTPPPSGEAGEPNYPVMILHVEKIPYKSPYALVFKVGSMWVSLVFKVGSMWVSLVFQVGQGVSCVKAFVEFRRLVLQVLGYPVLSQPYNHIPGSGTTSCSSHFSPLL